jgi:Domain of unknown function (DUF4398)
VHCIQASLDGVGFRLLRSIEKSTMAHFSSLRSLMPAAPGGVRSRARFPAILAVAGLAMSACVSAPVQEMSNARQAIRAAREAGAEKTAPQKLSEAEVLLNRAEDSLERRAYREARRNAIAARDKAAEALVAVKPDSNTG